MDRQEILNKICGWCNQYFSEESCEPSKCEIRNLIYNITMEDIMKIVRCRDCVYYEIGEDGLPYCNNADGGIVDYPREEDFCSYGEIKKIMVQI